ncbi:hypothetical protein Tco_0522158 [Tanacetum coccineum]
MWIFNWIISNKAHDGPPLMGKLTVFLRGGATRLNFDVSVFGLKFPKPSASEIVEPSSPSMLCASSDRLDLCYQGIVVAYLKDAMR